MNKCRPNTGNFVSQLKLRTFRLLPSLFPKPIFSQTPNLFPKYPIFSQKTLVYPVYAGIYPFFVTLGTGFKLLVQFIKDAVTVKQRSIIAFHNLYL